MAGKLYSIESKPSTSQEEFNNEFTHDDEKTKFKHPLSEDYQNIIDPIDNDEKRFLISSTKLPHSQSAPLSELLSQIPDEKQSIFSGIRNKLVRVGAESREIIDKHISLVKSVGNQEVGKPITFAHLQENTKLQEMSEVKFKELKDLNSESASRSTVKSPMINIEQLMNMVRKSDPSHDDSEIVKEIAEFCGRRKTLEELPKLKRSSSLDKMKFKAEIGSVQKPKSEKNKIKIKDTVRYNKDGLAENVFLKRKLSHQNINYLNEEYNKEISDQSILVLDKPSSSIFLILKMIIKYISFKICIFFAAILAYLVISPTSYFSGLLLGLFVGYLIAYFMNFFKLQYTKFLKKGVEEDFLKSLHMESFNLPVNSEGRFKGWMNELSSYDPNNYHINHTHSVFITLEGFTLRIQTPRQGIAKRALCTEEIPNIVGFVRQQHYNLRGCVVKLLPNDLTGKRLWSKKYPICLEVSLHSAAAGNRPAHNMLKDISKRHSLGRLDNAEKSRMDTKYIYLFARCCREKEEWYRRFESVSRGFIWPQNFTTLIQKNYPINPEKLETNISRADLKTTVKTTEEVNRNNFDRENVTLKRSKSNDEISKQSFGDVKQDLTLLPPQQNLFQYAAYMHCIIQHETNVGTSVDDLFSTKNCSKHEGNITSDSLLTNNVENYSILWLNTFLGRLFFDLLRENYWKNKIREKIQKKLGKMHVPSFMESLTVTEISLGPRIPHIISSSRPYLNDRGLWIEFEVNYSGGFRITMETKCNLMKLKQKEGLLETLVQNTQDRPASKFSDEEDSAESSTDEELSEENYDFDQDERKPQFEPMSKKIFKLVDRISQSKYFQQATDYKYIRRAMQEVSNTPLILNVELKCVKGTLAINIPPPPSDRMWYGFKGIPDLKLVARPQVGDREVNWSHVTEWIEKKLTIEFQRVFVIPNMDDIQIPLMVDYLHSKHFDEKKTL